MGEAQDDRESAFAAQSDYVAAVVCVVPDYGTLHAGIVFRPRGTGSFSLLHLGFHDRLFGGPWPLQNWPADSFFWAVPDAEPERMQVINSLCRKVHARFIGKPEMPYGIEFFGSTFNPVTGAPVLRGTAQGYTCATFVLALFLTYGIEMVDENTWPVRIDDDVALVERCRRFDTEATYQRLLAEAKRGVRRIRPEEMLAAMAYESPAKWSDVRGASADLLARMSAVTWKRQ